MPPYLGPNVYNDRDNAILREVGVASLEITLTAAGLERFVTSLNDWVTKKGLHRPMLYAVYLTTKKQERRCTQVLARIADAQPKATHKDVKLMLGAMNMQSHDALKIISHVRQQIQEALVEIAAAQK